MKIKFILNTITIISKGILDNNTNTSNTLILILLRNNKVILSALLLYRIFTRYIRGQAMLVSRYWRIVINILKQSLMKLKTNYSLTIYI